MKIVYHKWLQTVKVEFVGTIQKQNRQSFPWKKIESSQAEKCYEVKGMLTFFW